jgi:hypothetical protein
MLSLPCDVVFTMCVSLQRDVPHFPHFYVSMSLTLAPYYWDMVGLYGVLLLSVINESQDTTCCRTLLLKINHFWERLGPLVGGRRKADIIHVFGD